MLYGVDLLGGSLGVLLSVPVLNHVNSVGFLLVVPIALTVLVLLRIGKPSWVWSLIVAELIAAVCVQVFDVPRLEARTLRTIVDAPGTVSAQWSARAYMELYERKDSTWIVNQDHGSTVFVRPYHEGSLGCLGRSKDEFCQVGLSLKLVNAVRRPRSACVIAAGTGQQMIQCHVSGIAMITGVEVNSRLRALVNGGDAGANLESFYRRPDVNPVIDEARHYLRRSRQTFDLILVPSIFAAFQQRVALHSYLFTEEAVQDYVGHLSDLGLLLFVMPLIPRFTPGALEPAREYLSLIDRGLRKAGLANPQDHVMGVVSDAEGDRWARPLQYILVSHSTWTAAEIASLHSQVESTTREDVQRDESWSNDQWIRRDWHPSGQLYRLLTWRQMAEKSELAEHTTREITDDFPWLFEPPLSLEQVIRGSMLLNGDSRALQAFGNVLALLGVATLIAFPLARRRRECSSPRDIGVLSFFFFVGCGFMFLEIALMDKLVFILGSSSYSIAFCLASLLVGAGSSSLLCKTLFSPSGNLSASKLNGCLLVLIACLLALYVYAQPLLVPVMALSTPVQYALLTPPLLALGMFLGVPFPQGLAMVGARGQAWIPWAWGVNGAGSVLSINAAGLLYGSISLSTALLISAALYVLGALALNAFLLPGARDNAT